MKATMEVRHPAEMRNSQRTGKNYATQAVGLRLPGEEYPVAREIFVQLDNGKPKSLEPGQYEVELSITDDRQAADVFLRINARSAVRIEAKPDLAAGKLSPSKLAA